MSRENPRLAERSARRQRRGRFNRQQIAVALVALVVIIMIAVFYARLVAPAGAAALVTTADNRDYFPVVHSLLQGAERSIDVILYQSRFYFEYPASTSNTLIVDLVEARERGVRVRAVLEAADWNLENSEDNRDVWEVLRLGGVETYFDPVSTTSHSKMVIVDGKYVVMGSMNWSYYALDRNIEATAIIESEEIGERFGAYFDEIIKAGTTDYPLPIEAAAAAGGPPAGTREVFMTAVADSGRLAAVEAGTEDGTGAVPEKGAQAGREGWLHFGPTRVRLDEDALEEVLALDSLFFNHVAGDSVRVVGRREGEGEGQVRAVDVKTAELRQAVAEAFAAERASLKSKSLPKPALTWVKSAKVVPIPNDAYADEVVKLIGSAKSRIWIALLDARYYDKRPDYADPAKARHGGALPSLTNLLLDALQDACHRGVDVRLVIDMGRGDGRVPETKAAFLAKLREAGGKVYEDSPDVTTHAKVLIVDDDYTVVGSTNWSLPALEENNETAVVIESQEMNRHYADFISSAAPDFGN